MPRKNHSPFGKIESGTGAFEKNNCNAMAAGGGNPLCATYVTRKNPGHWCTQKGMSFCMDPGKMEKIQKIKAVAYTNKEEQRTEKNEDLEVILWQKKKN